MSSPAIVAVAAINAGDTEIGGKGFNDPGRFTFDLDGGKVRRMKITAE